MKSTSWKLSAFLLVLSLSTNPTRADETATRNSARKPVRLPGLVVDFENQCVDLNATVCLNEGYLELVACTKDGKKHESIVAVSARPMHIHTALLLLGAINGHPAMRRPVDETMTRWVTLPPRGDAVAVFLVLTDAQGKATERPVSDFIVWSQERIDEVDGEVIVAPGENERESAKKLPHTFTFAGSHLKDNGPGPRQYLADLSGHVISIATFGDELLCLPFHQTQANNELMWRVKPGTLPEVGTKVTLRLRPVKKPSSHKKSASDSTDQQPGNGTPP